MQEGCCWSVNRAVGARHTDDVPHADVAMVARRPATVVIDVGLTAASGYGSGSAARLVRHHGVRTEAALDERSLRRGLGPLDTAEERGAQLTHRRERGIVSACCRRAKVRMPMIDGEAET